MPEREPTAPSYGIGAVARRFGLPAPTLRTWDQRYGLGPSLRTAGGHRRYTELDVRRIEEMHRLVRAGAPAAEAAEVALRILRPGSAPRRPAAEAPRADESRSPAGWEEPLYSVTQVVRAALSLDSWFVTAALDNWLRERGVAHTWDHLVIPVFAAISRRQDDTGAGIDLEHLFSERVLAALAPLVERPAAPVHPRPVLLACAEEEQHSLPLFALAAALTVEHRVECRVMGARMPYDALADAIRRLAPAAVFLWSHQAGTGDPAPLAGLPRLRPAAAVFVGGPGWGDLPAGVVHLRSLDDAITSICAVLR
ncbi:MerR family transcriptional regulator [Herbidospora sp. NEAU-GS84]|uniref:MerR family transcriptional regulator n=1 Tax=Herbidospora solisilvae TaxID=2696284 RepID=A0A7C9N8P8_9ACTN|nr:MerR family transcriptional regulator [Herbidospora solisilvae]NAS24213.1 MerR family transcriptional regulator [Herbidospora solisilvae]